MMDWMWLIFGLVTFAFALGCSRSIKKAENDEDSEDLETSKWIFAYIVFVLIWVGVILI